MARECGKLNWLWVNATRQVTAFRVAAKRAAVTAREVIGRATQSVITTDRYLGYSWLAPTRRQVCWAHLKRDFQAIAERGGESQEIGEALLAQTKEVFRLWHQVTAGDLSRRKFWKLIAPVQQKIKGLLNAGSECRSSKTRGTCRQIRMVEAALWTFVCVEGVEPTNNEAERGVMATQILWHTEQSGKPLCRTDTYGRYQFASARTQCVGVFDYGVRFGGATERGFGVLAAAATINCGFHQAI